ncbi:MAG TPA: PfkB family carbohydrate kinase [Opitutales bacterium]|nr:PfkB family carbohydrate kinase [Opitutales bacterium]
MNPSSSTKKIYLYGMVCQSTIHRLGGVFPKLDTYGEIAESFFLPGGEAGNSAVVLKNLGYDVKLEGPFLGTRTQAPVTEFYSARGIDVSGMKFDASFGGVEDLVLVAEGSRTVFGAYAHYFTIPTERWQAPDESAIAASDIVGLDPFFKAESDLVVHLCVKHAVPYVTIDCEPDCFMAENAAALVMSNEYIQNKHAGENLDELHRRYTERTAGLVMFTFGGRDILFGRKGGAIAHMKPYEVKVVSTLGAGDTFRAGIMHGILTGGGDAEIVKRGAAMAGCVCTKFPIGFNPPSGDEIDALIAAQPR